MLHDEIPGIRPETVDTIDGWIAGLKATEGAAAFVESNGHRVVAICTDKGIWVWTPGQGVDATGTLTP